MHSYPLMLFGSLKYHLCWKRKKISEEETMEDKSEVDIYQARMDLRRINRERRRQDAIIRRKYRIKIQWKPQRSYRR